MFGFTFGKKAKTEPVATAGKDTVRVVITDEHAYNAVRANYGSMAYNSMSQGAKDILARDEFLRLSMAVKHMPDGVITPEAIKAYIAEQSRQKKLQGELVEDKNEDDKRLSRIAANHVLTCTFDPSKNFDIVPA